MNTTTTATAAAMPTTEQFIETAIANLATEAEPAPIAPTAHASILAEGKPSEALEAAMQAAWQAYNESLGLSDHAIVMPRHDSKNKDLNTLLQARAWRAAIKAAFASQGISI